MIHKPVAPDRSQHSYSYKPDDVEQAISSSRRKPRFRDVVNAAVHDNFHAELKRKLREGVDKSEMEQYRKSLVELKDIKDKKIRAFYEQQNDRLNDCLEVNTLVTSMVDDVLDSMNPQDVRKSTRVLN